MVPLSSFTKTSVSTLEYWIQDVGSMFNFNFSKEGKSKWWGLAASMHYACITHSYLLLCNKLFPNIATYNKYLLSHNFWVGNSGTALVDDSGSRPLAQLQSSCKWRLQSSQDSTKVEESTSEFTQVLVGKLPLCWLLDQRAPSFITWSFPRAVWVFSWYNSLPPWEQVTTHTHTHTHIHNQDRSNSLSNRNLAMIQPSLLPYSVDLTSSGTI